VTVQSACFRVFEHARKQGQPLSVRDLAYLTQFSEEGCRVVIKVFRGQGWIEKVPTPFGLKGVYWQLVDGAVYPGDQRGRSAEAVAQLNAAREKRHARRWLADREAEQAEGTEGCESLLWCA